ncbi:MAG: alkaline phosphatase family protein, partial [Peptococcaceae bacterium]|nr:alkaline phosphatase family protein [Peptococcaceae bacterium]
TKRLVEEGKLPNVKKLMDAGACRDDLVLLGANPTITPPMWATLATGAYPMTHSIQDFNLSGEDLEITYTAIYSTYMKAEPLWDVTAKAGKKTLLMHWPGGAWPPTLDDENLMVIDGSSPGAACSVSNAIDFDTVFIASTKAQKPSWMPYSIRTSDVQGDETLGYLGLPQKSSQSPEAKELMAKYYKEYAELNEVPGYTTPAHFITNSIQFEDTTKEFSGRGLMWDLADFPSTCSISPVFPPQQWGFEVPADAKEFIMLTLGGKVVRYCLILKDESGKYNKVAMYADKAKDEPIAVLENDVYTPYVMDVVPTATGMEPVHRTFRVLEIAEDGSYVRIWASRAMSCVNDSVWQPKALFKEIVENVGQLVPTSQMTGNDPDMILKCNLPQWQMAAEWQSKVMHHMIENHGVEVIFSHMHNIDLMSHNYIKYMKERSTSKITEAQAVEYAEATYKVTDDYLGSFLHLMDEGWTIILFSDHALICPEAEAHVIGENCGVCVDPFRAMGYTVMKKDENGNDLPEVDWSQTKAIQTRSNSIYINLKGRQPHGIVDPADKYELEEQIITDLYGYKDEKTGHRIVSLALHNKDAVLLGLGGPTGADIVLFVHDDYCYDHGNGLSTACGYNDTSLSPIFIAAGPGIKQNFRTTRYVREVDIAPTAAVLLGVDIPAECEGAPAYQILTEAM